MAAVRTAPPPLAWPLLTYIAILVALWLAGLIAMAVGRPGPAELVQLCSRFIVAIIRGSHLTSFALIWGVLPVVPALT